MKVCAACHEDLPKDSYSKKQWKLDKYQRRCKVCITNNREVQLQQPLQQDNDGSKTNEIVKALDSICLKDVEKIYDEELFKQPPAEDCPICFLCLPTLEKGWRYMPCCGKVICSGCVHAPVYDHQGNEVDNEKCPFCRTPDSKSEKVILERLKKRVEAGDAIAIYNLGCYYQYAAHGFPQDYKKALELFNRAAGNLGHAGAYLGIGNAYDYGQGVKVDKKKANHYYELAAIKGDADARHNLGINEKEAGNTERALKHHMIAVRNGDNDSLGTIKQMYSKGYATKEDYTKALQSYQAYFGEIKSPQRDKAAAANEDYRYY